MEKVIEYIFVEKVDENGIVYTEVEEEYYETNNIYVIGGRKNV